jgi:hydrogenase-4 component B
MMLSVALICTVVLLALAVLAVLMVRSPLASRLIYAACMLVTAVCLAAALTHLLGARAAEELSLPIGLPWLGAHLRLDSLSAFFLVVLDLGAMTASLFALGYGEHERSPGRVVPFFPAFLAAMTLVVLADDAFTFLLS